MMSENSGVDAAALRREARRRKILENSEKRLTRITGRASSLNETLTSDTFRSHRDESNGETPNFPFEESIRFTSEGVNDFTGFPTFERIYDATVDEETKETATEKDKSYLKSIMRKRFHYVILSVVAQLMYYFNLGFLFYNNLFCPFITLKAMELVFVHDVVKQQQPNTLKLLASLTKGSVIASACKAFSIAENIISDFLLYIFSFILSYKLFGGIKEAYYT